MMSDTFEKDFPDEEQVITEKKRKMRKLSLLKFLIEKFPILENRSRFCKHR